MCLSENNNTEGKGLNTAASCLCRTLEKNKHILQMNQGASPLSSRLHGDGAAVDCDPALPPTGQTA